jgi:hypothetical protein
VTPTFQNGRHLSAALDTAEHSGTVRLHPHRSLWPWAPEEVGHLFELISFLVQQTQKEQNRNVAAAAGGSCRRLYSGRIDKLSAKQATILFGGSAEPCRQPLAFCCSFIVAHLHGHSGGSASSDRHRTAILRR